MRLLSTWRRSAAIPSSCTSPLSNIAIALMVLSSLSTVSAWPLFAQPKLVKRQAPSVISTCGLYGNQQTICFPTVNDTLYNNTGYDFVWNTKHPVYAALSEVDIFLFYHTDFRYNPVKNWTNISNVNSGGQLPVLTDNSFFAKPLAPGSPNVTLQYALFIVGSGVDPNGEIYNINSRYPKPVHFNFTENSANISTVTINTSSILTAMTPTHPVGVESSASIPATITPQQNSSAMSSSKQSSLPPWVIAVITVVGVSLMATIIIAIILIRALKKKGKYDKKVYTVEPMIIAPNSKGATNYDNRDISSIHSTTPIIREHQRSATNEGNISVFSGATGRGTVRRNSGGNRSNYSSSFSPSSSPQQLHTQLISPTLAAADNPQIPIINEPRTSTSLLTSNDAILIADTFRQFMRKPDWQEQELNDLSSPTTPGDDEDEEERRRRLGDELLRKELAEEGTPMQRVQRKATQVNVVDDEKQGVLTGVTEGDD